MMTQASIASTAGVPHAEITVIIHGPIIHDLAPGAPSGMTRAAVQSVRNVLPGAKVIISTWAGSAAEGLGADQVVYSPDPGTHPPKLREKPNNVNRQIAAMRAGLGLVDTRWTLKLRSDTVLVTSGMVACWDRYPERHPYLQVFERRIVTSALLTHHPRLCFRRQAFTTFLFHVNDMMQFGLSRDLRRLWDIPFMPAADFAYFTEAQVAGKADMIGSRRVPEDYVWTTVLAAAGFPIHDSWLDFQPTMLPVSELSIVNNFQLLDHDDMGFLCLKYPRFGDGHHPLGAPFFTHREWLSHYRLHCDPAVKVPRLTLPTAKSLWRGLRNGLNIVRQLEFLKRCIRPERQRFKEALRRYKLWK